MLWRFISKRETFDQDYDQEKLFFDYDVALITLPQSFHFDQYVNAVCLPNQIGTIDDSWDKKFTISGFGQINSQRDFPRRLQFHGNSKKI